MSLGLAFWIIWLIVVVFGVLAHFGIVGVAYAPIGGVILLILITLLGWSVFGPPLRS